LSYITLYAQAGFQKGDVIIVGKIDNHVSMKIGLLTLRFGDWVMQEGDNQFVQRLDDSTGAFAFRFTIYHPKEIFLETVNGSQTLPLFVKQGDSLHIQLNAIDFAEVSRGDFPSTIITGTNSHIQPEIIAYRAWKGIPHFYPEPAGKTASQYQEEVVAAYLQAKDSIDAYFDRHKSSPVLKHHALQDLTYGYANYLIDYVFYQLQLDQDTTLDIQNIYDKAVLDTFAFPFSPPAVISSEYYPLHVGHTALYRHWTQEVRVLSETGDSYQATRQLLERFQRYESQGLGREIMSYMKLRTILEKEPQIFTRLWGSLDSTFITHPVLRTYLNTQYENILEDSSLAQQHNPESKALHDQPQTFFSHLAHKHQGKVMYIDIWATWCAPCIRQFPYAAMLHDSLQNTPVAFVYICLDPDPTRWKDIIDRFNLKGDHYYFDTEQSTLLKDYLGFAGVPRYVLFDRKGHIVDLNADAPQNSKKLLRTIKELVK